jgi:hypothetical protein
MTRHSKFKGAAFFVFFGLTAAANASVTFTMQQVGNDVVASGSGTLNLSSLTNRSFATLGGLVWGSLSPGSGLAIGSASSEPVNTYITISGPASFGSGAFFAASSGGGTTIGVVANQSLSVSTGYLSGSPLSATSTWNNQTLAGLGVTPGTYVWTWGSGASADSFTFIIGPQASTTPEPISILLVAGGLAALGLLKQRRS